LVGALARAVWARPRASTDVDFAVAYDPERLPLLYEALTRARFERTMELRAASEKDELPELSVDFLVTHTPFEQEALSRRVSAIVGPVHTFVVSPEDLIVYKLLAGRPKDWDDMADVVATRAAAGQQLDWAYIQRWAEAWGVEERLERLRAEAVTDR
jgi:hypothetical protein